MNSQYKTTISDARWIAYDIPGNIGWIIWLVCVSRGLREKRDAYSIASALPGILMLLAKDFFVITENISYQVAAGNISKELLSRIMTAIMDNTYDQDEELKLEIYAAISKES